MRNRDASAVAQVLPHLCFTDWTESVQVQAGAFTLGLTWIRREGFRPIHVDPDAGVTIAMVGHVYGRDTDRRIDAYFGRLVEAYRQRGTDALCAFGGAGGVVLIDHKDDSAFVVTDQSGAFPLFVGRAEDPDRAVVSTHPDALAACLTPPPDLDEATIAGFVTGHGRGFPNTHYRDVDELTHATVYRWDDRAFRPERTHWKFEPRLNGKTRLDDCAERLAAAVQDAVRMRMNTCGGRLGILLSGGLDSRAAAMAARGLDHPACAITFGDEVNREIRFAQELARRAGMPHVFLKREPEFYAHAAVEAIRMTAGTGDFRHTHSLGFSRQLRDLDLGLIVSGDLADILFKGAVTNRIVSRRLPFLLSRERLGPVNRYFWPEVRVARTEIRNPRVAREVERRRGGKLEHLKGTCPSATNWLRVEYKRAFPLWRASPACFQGVLWRTAPFDMVFVDHRVLAAFERIPSRHKLNKQLSRRMVTHLSGAARAVPDANTGIRIDAPPLQESLLRLLRKVGRWTRLDRRGERQNRLATNESWINWEHYMKTSPVLCDLWDEARAASEGVLADILGFSPFDESVEQMATRSPFFGRAMSVGLWLKHRIGNAAPARRPVLV